MPVVCSGGTGPLKARTEPLHDMTHRTRRTTAASHLFVKDACESIKVSEAIQQASPAHRILNITARAAAQFNTAYTARLIMTLPTPDVSRETNTIR